MQDWGVHSLKRGSQSHLELLQASLCKDGRPSGGDMGQRNKVGPFRETFLMPHFPTFCRLAGESDHFQVILSPRTITCLPQSLEEAAQGKLIIRLKIKVSIFTCKTAATHSPALYFTSDYYSYIAALPPSSAKWAPWLLLPLWFNRSKPAKTCGCPAPKHKASTCLPSSLSSIQPAWLVPAEVALRKSRGAQLYLCLVRQPRADDLQ